MKISVVIPAYNEEKYIGQCIKSLLRQTEPVDEIIIVNNNSTDNTVKIAKQYPVKIVNEKKQGITHARNSGFNEARYEIIARTDGDTILPPNWIKRIKKAFMDDAIVGISGPASFYDLPDIFQNSRWQTQSSWLKLIKSYNRIVKQLLKHDCLYGPNCAIRKQAWNKIKNEVCLDDKKVHEDLDLAIHLAQYGKIKFINNLIVKTSVRRWKHPEAYPEYLYRGLRSIQRHKQLGMKKRSKQLLKKFVGKAFSFDQISSGF